VGHRRCGVTAAPPVRRARNRLTFRPKESPVPSRNTVYAVPDRSAPRTSMSEPSPRARVALRLFAALCCVGSSLAAAAQPTPSIDARLAEVRDQMGSDTAQARALLERRRADAIEAQRLDARLAADELECRILSDSDAEAAEKVAAAGVAAAGRTGATTPAIINALLRLRACWAGVQMDLGKMAYEDPTLTRIIEQASADPSLAAARAMAQLERGLQACIARATPPCSTAGRTCLPRAKHSGA
jgi:hypothetical protein